MPEGKQLRPQLAYTELWLLTELTGYSLHIFLRHDLREIRHGL